eukprot:COSAG01_NODE_5928_length_3947_cov_3.364865_1_plen_38_part_10
MARVSGQMWRPEIVHTCCTHSAALHRRRGRPAAGAAEP